ncbi:restriction endonuclease subunit S [bacterium]|nr:restriction endonuclease subunit S [bacterium]
MSNKAERGPVLPNLRFPEFRDAGEWEIYSGDNLFEQVRDLSPEPGLPVLAITQEHGAIPRELIDYHVSVTEKSIESYKVVRAGNFIISLRSFQGGIEYSQYDGICSPAYVILRRRIDGSDEYFKHYLKTPRFIHILTRNLEGLRDGKMISYKQFSELQISVPTVPEQHKIAGCLASLDKLISLEAQKLTALKTHKQGLQQQLFPAEGETTPRLRFTEFKYAGGWGKVPLDKLAIRQTLRNNQEGITRVLTNSSEFGIVDQRDYFDKDIANQNNLEAYYIVETGDYVYNPRISRTAPVGPISKNKIGMGVMSPLYTVFKFIDSQNDFYECYFNSSGWYQYLRLVSNTGARHDRMAIGASDFMAMPLPFTIKEEQQQIADFLLAVDELIRFQDCKVAALKSFKMGMLQQLFPASDELCA